MSNTRVDGHINEGMTFGISVLSILISEKHAFPQLLFVQHVGQASSCPSSRVKETHLLFKIKSYFELLEVRPSKAAA